MPPQKMINYRAGTQGMQGPSGQELSVQHVDMRIGYAATSGFAQGKQDFSLEVLFRSLVSRRLFSAGKENSPPCHAGPAKVRAATCDEVLFFHAPSPEEGARGLQVPLWGPGSFLPVAGRCGGSACLAPGVSRRVTRSKGDNAADWAVPLVPPPCLFCATERH